MKRIIGLVAVIGLGWALALPASANTQVHVGLNTPGLQAVGFHNNRRSFRSRGFTNRRFNRGINRSFNRRGFSNRGFNNRSGLTLNFSNRNFISGNSGFRSGYSSGFSGSSCRRVTKRGYWNDRPALIGGRQCFDGDGYAYVVPSSRHLIRYY